MTNKRLDVDALEKLVNFITDKLDYYDNKLCYNQYDEDIAETHMITLNSVLDKIQELATPTPETQGVWYDDFTKAPDEYIAHNGCRLAWVDHDTITPLGDISAFDEDYFRQSMKQWQYMPQVPNGY